MSSDEELYQQWRAGQAKEDTAQLWTEWSDEDGGIIARYSDTPNLSGFGETREEAISELLTAYRLAFLVFRDDAAALRSEIATLRRLLDEAQRELAARDKPWLNQV